MHSLVLLAALGVGKLKEINSDRTQMPIARLLVKFHSKTANRKLDDKFI